MRHLLENVQTIEDLPRLFGALGYTPERCPIGDNSIIVGRWMSFLVVATASRKPVQAVHQICRTFNQSNTHVLAAAIAAHQNLVVGAPQSGSRHTPRFLNIQLTNPTADAINLLDRLRPGHARSALQHALRIEQLLASETVSERFYTRLKTTHDLMLASLPNFVPHTDGRMLTLLPLLRLLFLYFVQAKGWLAGEYEFLRNGLDQTLEQHRRFQRDYLNRLCFETLNHPRGSRSSDSRFTGVPYLNGGLFDRHPVEKKWPDLEFDNDIWRTVFDDVFERFRFCVREAQEVDAIAPDMLGRVFERIMQPTVRHATGTFYTPETVVRRIVDAALALSLTHLAGITQREANRVIAGEKVATDIASVTTALKNIRVLDPAVGSGAFLLASLDSLTRARSALESKFARRCKVVHLRRRILEHNLFGVDINPIAVRLAELRLWLSVIADDATTDINQIEPLPNLDGFVRQGDSLFDPIGHARSSCELGRVPAALAKEVTQQRSKLFYARGSKRAGAIASLRTAELQLAEATLRASNESIKSAMRDLISGARSRDLFGKRTGFDAGRRRIYANYRHIRNANRQALRAVREGTVPFFSYEVHAPEVMQEGGFTTVVGNPPWVRAERLGPRNRERLKNRFTWWRGGSGTGFCHLPDLSIAFTERALEVTRPGGAIGFLLPSKLVTAAYANRARHHLSHDVSLEYVHRIPDRDVVQFGATTYPLVLVAKKHKPASDHTVRFGTSDGDHVPQQQLQKTGPWLLIAANVQDAISTFVRSGTPLAKIAAALLGVKTGANDVFVGSLKKDTDEIRLLVMQDAEHQFVSSEVRPVIMGRDVSRFRVSTNKWIVWTHEDSGQAKTSLSSSATKYFQSHKRRLEKRADYVGGPIWTLYRVSAARGAHRVVWPDIVRQSAAVVLPKTQHADAIPLNSCYVAAAPDCETALVIAAVMNTTWATAFLKLHGDEARGGYRRMNARVANQIPIPPKNHTWPLLVELSRSAHHASAFNQTLLDEIVAKSLGLSVRACNALSRVAGRDG